MKGIIILFLLLNITKVANGQNSEDCVRKHLQFLSCKSHQLCSNNESEAYHRNLIASYFYILKNYYKSVLSDDYNQLGKEYFHLKDYDSAMYYYQIANNGKDTNAPCLNNIGTVLFMKGLYDSSYIYFNMAYAIDTTEQDYINNLASYYGTIGDYQKCIELSLKSLRIGRKYNANVVALNCLVITYGMLKNNAKLKKYKKEYDKLTSGKGIETEEIDCECTKYKPYCEI